MEAHEGHRSSTGWQYNYVTRFELNITVMVERLL